MSEPCAGVDAGQEGAIGAESMEFRHCGQSGHSPDGYFDHLYRPACTPGSARPPPRRALSRPPRAAAALIADIPAKARNGLETVIRCASRHGRLRAVLFHSPKPASDVARRRGGRFRERREGMPPAGVFSALCIKRTKRSVK